MGQHCATCTCGQDAPTYPVTCGECGTEYGPTSALKSHRPGSEFCQRRARERDKAVK